jgi:hypothetical protein
VDTIAIESGFVYLIHCQILLPGARANAARHFFCRAPAQLVDENSETHDSHGSPGSATVCVGKKRSSRRQLRREQSEGPFVAIKGLEAKLAAP